MLAEFCLECLNKISRTNYTEKDFIISKDLDFCEECCEYKHVVVVSKKSSIHRRLKNSFPNTRLK